MRVVFYLGLVLLIWVLSVESTSASTNTSVEVELADKELRNHRVMLVRMVARRLKTLWNNYFIQEENKDTFVGRCFGVAKKIKQLLPIVVFKLGVIMTLLGFLTLFSLKSIVMLGLLLLINTSGAVAKVGAALALHKGDESTKKQNIHLHIHQNKHGYHMDETSYGWEDRMDREEDLEHHESYNLYNKLLKRYN